MTTPLIPTDGLVALLDYGAVAKLLGLSVRQIAHLVKSGRLRAVRMGPRSVRFTVQDVQDFIAAARTGGAA